MFDSYNRNIGDNNGRNNGPGIFPGIAFSYYGPESLYIPCKATDLHPFTLSELVGIPCLAEHGRARV